MKGARVRIEDSVSATLFIDLSNMHPILININRWGQYIYIYIYI